MSEIQFYCAIFSMLLVENSRCPLTFRRWFLQPW